jgi:hypothetical protein
VPPRTEAKEIPYAEVSEIKGRENVRHNPEQGQPGRKGKRKKATR